jgi:hypothetical protein
MFVILNERPVARRSWFERVRFYFQKKQYMSLQSCGIDGSEFFAISIPHFYEDTAEMLYKRVVRGLIEGQRQSQKLLLPPVNWEYVPIAAQCGYSIYNPLNFKKSLALQAIARIKSARSNQELGVILFNPRGSRQDASFFIKLAELTPSITVYTREEESVEFYDELMEEYGIPVIVSSDQACLKRGSIILAFGRLYEEQRELSQEAVIIDLCPDSCCESANNIVIDDYFFNIPAHVLGNIPPGVKRVDFLGGLYELNGVTDVKYYRMTGFCTREKLIMPDQLC